MGQFYIEVVQATLGLDTWFMTPHMSRNLGWGRGPPMGDETSRGTIPPVPIRREM